MTKTYCDRCGRDITEIADYSISITKYDEDGDVVSTTEFDLCSPCAEEVQSVSETPRKKTGELRTPKTEGRKPA